MPQLKRAAPVCQNEHTGDTAVTRILPRYLDKRYTSGASTPASRIDMVLSFSSFLSFGTLQILAKGQIPGV